LLIHTRAVDTELYLLAKSIHSLNEVEVLSISLSNLVSPLHDVIRQEPLLIDAHVPPPGRNHVSVVPGSKSLYFLPTIPHSQQNCITGAEILSSILFQPGHPGFSLVNFVA
jgi:hypothetical protein